jgi:hypothetical protein
MLPVSLGCPFLIAPSIFFNVYCIVMEKVVKSQKLDSINADVIAAGKAMFYVESRKMYSTKQSGDIYVKHT